MQANNNLGSMHKLQHDLTYHQHLFNSSRKQGANFDELKKIHLRIKQLKRDIEALKRKHPVDS